MESLFFKLNSLFIPLKSIIPIPTEINSAERTGLGTIARYWPKPSNTIKRKIPLKIPLKLVVPLEFILATVPVVEPAPGIPPNKEVSKFPNPWPISSLFPLCLVLVILSATTEVSKVSIVPKPAKVKPLTIAMLISAQLKFIIPSILIPGNLFGISPIVENIQWLPHSGFKDIETNVPTTNAIKPAGNFFEIFGIK